MSLSPKELEEHCQQILTSSRIRNRIVVLCEGDIKEAVERKSPQAYRRMEQMPDANFYKKCVPRFWRDKPRPQFFNCGDRKDVIDSYFQLLKLHKLQTSESFLEPSKLFALVDLDIQSQKIDDHCFRDIEEIFRNLYQKNKVTLTKSIDNYHIWVTGLIHKEAYFITPNVQEVFNNSIFAPQYQNNSVLLENIYLTICDEITKDIDLRNNFDRAMQRINYCQDINCCDLDQLKDSWQQAFTNSSDEQQKRELVLLLLTIRKAKKYWQQIKPHSNCNIDIQRFREQLSLAIGEFYSRQDWHNPENHIASFFRNLYEYC